MMENKTEKIFNLESNIITVFVILLHLAPMLYFFFNYNTINQQILDFSKTEFEANLSMNDEEQDNLEEELQKIKNSTEIITKKEILKIDKKISKAASEKVNKSLKPAIFNASYLKNADPIYPPLSRRLNENGSVMLNVLINANGRAEQIFIEESSGFERLDNAAINAVKKWNFIPAKIGDESIKSWAKVPINFVLEK